VVYLDWVLFQNPNRLGLKLCVYKGNPFSTVWFMLNLNNFFGNLSRFKFLGVLLLHMVLSILKRHIFNQLHSLMPFILLVSYQFTEVLKVCLDWVFQFSLYLFLYL
jgi:hypothetical protein